MPRAHTFAVAGIATLWCAETDAAPGTGTSANGARITAIRVGDETSTTT